MEIGEAFVIGFVVIFVVLAVVFLIGYIMDSLLKAKIFRLFGTCSPGLAWVPFLSSYMLGRTCNGKDGQNIGLFGMSVPNWLYNFGWLAYPACVFVFGFLNRVSGGHLHIGNLGTITYNVITFLYWGSIYSFLYSRLEGRPENEVRLVSIVSASIGLVGFVKIISSPNVQVYSLDNDEFPIEGTPGGYGGQSGGYDGGYVSDTSGSLW